VGSADLGLGGGRHGLNQDRRQVIDGKGHRAVRLGHEVDRAQFEGRQRRLRPLAGQRRDHHHRTRPLNHDPVQALQAVHAGHLDIQRHDVWREGVHLGQALDAVAGDGHLEPRVPQNLNENTAHQRGIVDDKNLGH
jgi:hypothetical protein